MRLKLKSEAPSFTTNDIYGDPVKLDNYKGKPLILSFFCDAACPFCNLRVFEYTQKHKEWAALGIEVLAVFSSSSDEVKEFVAKHPRPFRTVGDPDLEVYKTFGIRNSVWGLVKALLFKRGIARRGIELGAVTDKKNPNMFLLPADFLIGPTGKVIDAWYGSDPTDHMPMKRLERFIDKVKFARMKAKEKREKAAASK